MEKNKPAGHAMPSASDILRSATGPIAIRLTNDYLFRALLQRSNKTLRGLIGALLHLEPEQIQSAVITNPIELGAYIDEKTFLLDVKVILNNNIVINLEMQVVNEHNWPERSLSYVCRAFDNLNSGEAYHQVKPVIHIGLLDFTLFPEHPEFYATYQLLNIKNHTVYSDKLRLSVLDLTQIALATEEDKRYHIDRWAALFKAATWEELKMYAQKDEYIQEASSTIYQLSQDESVRLQCEAREDYYRRQRSVQLQMEEKDSRIEEQNQQLAQKDSRIEAQDRQLAQKDSHIEALSATVSENNAAIMAKDSIIAELQAELARLTKSKADS